MPEKQKRRASPAAKGTLRLRWIRSAIAAPIKHKLVIKGLGFTRLNQVIEREDTPAIRGMVKKVPHLVQVLDGSEARQEAKP
jgi:large subunit ribosomal protein L30